jgi:caspase domain-containing protein
VRERRKRVLTLIVFGAVLLSADCGGQDPQPAPPSGPAPAVAGVADGCTAAPVGEPGHRFLALLVGVGKFKNPAITTLQGPANDVAAMRGLLVDRYGFPPANVCTLLDAAATTAAFREAFDRTLVQRAAANDVAVLYFSGHGSQTPDTNGDDSGDGWDETLLFHDARADGVKDLVDDELNGMLERLYARTHNVVVILDSCNSGSATRDAGDPSARARFQPAAAGTPTVVAGSMGGSQDPWVPASMPGATILTAASDGTSALEIGGKGVFTDALVQVLGRPGRAPLTYAQLARQVPPLIETRSRQIPYFQGDLDRDAFGATARPRPMAWEVRRAGPVVEIAGPPTPGLDAGAELRVYPPALAVADYGDPAKARATIVVDESTGLNAKAHVLAAASGAAPPAAGDLAILVRPSDTALRITVNLRPEGRPGGLPRARAEAIKGLIAQDPDARASVVVTDSPGLFELSRTADGLLVVRDQANVVRNVLKANEDVAPQLALHSRQNALRNLHGENGSDFADDGTLQVEIVPADRQKPCGAARVDAWVAAPPNSRQVIPLCVIWNIKVTLDARAPLPLLVGGVVLSTDGDTYGFPQDDSVVELQPGGTHTFSGDRFVAKPPLGVQDMVRVFGTQRTNHVPWNLVTQGSRTRSVSARGAASSPLFRALDRYFTPGARGAGRETGPVEDTTWTVSTLAMEVEANPGFAKAGPASGSAPTAKEYTLPKFDVRPYLPDDRSSGLYAVLMKAEWLAHRQVDYKQHDWTGADDEANLAVGIDCSRAIWFAFTRAGLRYNSDDAYLSTADMVGSRSRMREQFDRIDVNTERRIGDILVYRDDQRGDGHVVMVIDPLRRIAWGSHGWDGTARELPIAPQTGVEYQLIKYKPDWDRWDRKTMELKAVWRYREFSRQADQGKGLPGVQALLDPCDPAACSAASSPPSGPAAAPTAEARP